MDYAKQLERIEAKKAKERMAVKKQGTVHGPEVKKVKLETSLEKLQDLGVVALTKKLRIEKHQN